MHALKLEKERERQTDRQTDRQRERATERETRERENRTQHRGVNMLTSTKVLKVRTIDKDEPRYEQRYKQIIERGALLGHAHYTGAMRISRWQWLAEKEIEASQRTVSITVTVSVRDLPHD